VVQHEVVAVRIAEERHVAHARVEHVPEELHALALELRLRGGDVVDAERQPIALLRNERHADGLRRPDAQARVARPELVLGVVVRAQGEHVAVERPRAVRVLRRDTDEVDSLNHAHRPHPNGNDTQADRVARMTIRA
jgi:hypothetical protein